MKIDRKWLEEKRACKEGKEWFLEQGIEAPIEGLNNLIKHDKIDWANWLIVHVMDHKQKVRYVVFAAEQVIGIFEKKYPGDKRPRYAIEAAKKWIEDPSYENKKVAAAADSAHAASYAASYSCARKALKKRSSKMASRF